MYSHNLHIVALMLGGSGGVCVLQCYLGGYLCRGDGGFRGCAGVQGAWCAEGGQGERGQVVNYPDRHPQLLRPRVPVWTCGLAFKSDAFTFHTLCF